MPLGAGGVVRSLRGVLGSPQNRAGLEHGDFGSILQRDHSPADRLRFWCTRVPFPNSRGQLRTGHFDNTRRKEKIAFIVTERFLPALTPILRAAESHGWGTGFLAPYDVLFFFQLRAPTGQTEVELGTAVT